VNVVYHIASMTNWQEVVLEQFGLIRLAELNQCAIRYTHVGPVEDLKWIECTAREFQIEMVLVRNDVQILHYETFAMLEIERLAKCSNEPFLYFHTKGVSAGWHDGKRSWRRLMQREVLAKWKSLLPRLEASDAIGVGWLPCERPHFSGNFWLARADWIRKLPDFATYHNQNRLERTW
jgi:hypothetical protein